MTAITPPSGGKTRRARYQARRKHQISEGRWQPYVDAGPARAHVKSVTDATGVSLTGYAACAGISLVTLAAIMGGRDRVKPPTAAKILAVTPATARATAPLTGAAGARRRLQALAVTGWPVSQVAARCGISRAALHQIRDGRRTRITTATAQAITSVYDGLVLHQPPADTPEQRLHATRTRMLAHRNGWAPGFAWDDIDSPADRPRGIRKKPPPMTRAARNRSQPAAARAQPGLNSITVMRDSALRPEGRA